MSLTNQELAKKIDHTLLNADVTKKEIEKVCEEAVTFRTASVCVNSGRVKLAANYLKDSGVNPIAVVGFPLGASNNQSKVLEGDQAIVNGAEEIDMVINIGALLDGEDMFVQKDIQAVAEVTHQRHKLLKVIIETCYLTNEQKVRACQLAEAAGTDFVKTSTGFGSDGATLHDVELMRETVSANIGIKAAGGIHTKQEALAMLEAGADRLGMSATVQVLSEEN